MFFPSRVEPSHARVVGHSVYRQHVSRSPSIHRMRVSVAAKIVETGDHTVLQTLIDDILTPEITHTVLDPFKIGNSNAPSVSENIRNNKNALLMQYFVRRGSGWSICSFGKYLAPYFFRVL